MVTDRRRGRLRYVIAALLWIELVLIVMFRIRCRPAIDAVRRFNRLVLNPLMLLWAGKRHWYAGVVHHVGRRSGRDYRTPVVVEEVGDELYIPLPYGRDVDWYQNLHAAGQGMAVVRGERYRVIAPQVVPASEVASLLSFRKRLTLGAYGVKEYLRLRKSPLIALPPSFSGLSTLSHPEKMVTVSDV